MTIINYLPLYSVLFIESIYFVQGALLLFESKLTMSLINTVIETALESEIKS
jgi:hypothetical protein